MKEKYFRIEGDYIVLDRPYMEAYIPKELVSQNPEKGNPTAYFYGDGIRTVGLFNIRFYNSDEDKRESSELKTFKYSNVITMYPSSYDALTLRLAEDMEPDTYYVFKFYKDDIIMSKKIQQSSQNCEFYMNLLIRGKLPKGISYDDLYFAWYKNFKINNVNPGVPAITLQTILSENCRSKSDPMKQFRKVVSDPGVSKSDYIVSNMVKICSNSSVLNALTFERFGEMLSYVINMSKDDVKQNTTPLEDVLTM